MRRFVSPTPRLEAGRALAGPGLVSAMIDVSDGLLRDVGHLCEASGVDAVVLERFVPRSAAYRALAGEDPTAALCGGEDYELVFTVAPGKIPRLGKLIPRLNCRVTFIGRVVRGRGRVWVQDRSGRLVRPEQTGFDHFAKAKMPKRIPVTP
jgi:thiamine-monophosphate kinase